MSKITHTTVRMYKMGTGDCFVLKFFAGETIKYKLMIDCGTWSGSKDHLEKYLQVLKADVDNHINILIVTHEHKDHVHGFDVCRELLLNEFQIDQVWMGWTEDERNPKVKKWQKDFGDKKKSLAIAARELKKHLADHGFRNDMSHEFNGEKALNFRHGFADSLDELNELHNSLDDGNYVGGLAGMKVVKDQLAKDKARYYGPGDVIDLSPDLEGVKFYVLGPPKKYEGQINVEEGGKGESYDHNKELEPGDAFGTALLALDGADALTEPFDQTYFDENPLSLANKLYQNGDEAYRKIDSDWLNSAGSLALRINSITNNLSLALAIEFEDSGRVMLFPGDAEYGSWASWHNIAWEAPSRNEKKHLTEDLLNRTVFYKVAHHLSHHGTAKRLGLEMMGSPDLTAMATLDYSVISNRWTKTMPNKAILKELITKTKGRLMVMNEDQLTVDIAGKISLASKLAEVRKKMTAKDRERFEQNVIIDPLFIEYRIEA